MRRVNIGVKISGAFVAIFILIIIMGGAVNMFIKQQGTAQAEAIGKMEEIIFFVEKEVDHLNWINALANMFITGETFTGQLDHTKCAFGSWYYDILDGDTLNGVSEQFKETFLAVEEPHRYLHASASKILDITSNQAADASNVEAIRIYQQETTIHMAGIREKLAILKEILGQEQQQMLDYAAKQVELTYQVLIGITIVVIAFGIIIATVLTRTLIRPIGEVVYSLREMAEQGGDLTRRISVNSNDEVGDLSRWFNAFMEKLQGIVREIKGSTDTVTNASLEISSGNQDLSQRTEEQAASLEEVSSIVEEISTSMKQTTEHASSADSLSRHTLDKVNAGEKVIKELQTAMQEITASSNEIANITSAVNDIAFQTNLLALNAAVEAARAGEQGRGFAVVAQEVRNLAGRSAESAKEIEQRIKDSIERVKQGNKLMVDTETVLAAIVENTRKSTQLITEIVSTFKEQTVSITEIHRAIDELNIVTQQNASLVEQIASSSEQMSGESGNLSGLVAQFKTE